MKIVLKILCLPITLVKKIASGIEYMLLPSYLKSISINKIDAISGYEFEKYLTALLKTIGCKTTTTKKAHDYGADIVAKYKKDTYIFQAKLYYNHSVGLSAIQEAKSAKDYYLGDKAVVITNSHFTKSAITLAKATNVALIDREKLISLIQADKKEKQRLFHLYTIA